MAITATPRRRPPPRGPHLPPTRLIFLAWAALAAGFTSAAVIAVDIYGRGYRQRQSPKFAGRPPSSNVGDQE